MDRSANRPASRGRAPTAAAGAGLMGRWWPGATGRNPDWFTLLVSAYGVYATLFILRTSFVIEGVRYFVLFDDEMISMRYAKHLANGYGLVWNPGGERVEGYTNLLWTLYMALVHLLPVPAAKISLVIQLTGAVCLLANLVVVKRLAEAVSGPSRFAAVAAVGLTAFYLPLNNWGLQGTEVSLLTLITSAALRWTVAGGQGRLPDLWLWVALALGTLVRLDFVVTALAILVFQTATDRAFRRRGLLLAAGVLLLAVAAQTLFRLAYYGDPLPNTYYLKMTGVPPILRITRGLYVTLLFVHNLNPLLLLVPLGLLLIRHDRPVRLLGWICLVQVAYSVYVGGDAWEWWGGSNRFVTLVMPAFFVLFAAALAALPAYLGERLPDVGRLVARHGTRAQVVLLLMGLLSFNAISGLGGLTEWLLVRRALNVEPNAHNVQLALVVARVTTPGARIASVWAGAPHYFSDRYGIDLLGKSDRRIARGPAHLELYRGLDRLTAFQPGHSKWDLKYSIGQLRPDVVVRWHHLTIPEDLPDPRGEYRAVDLAGARLFLQRGSPNVQWDRVAREP